MSVLTHPDLTIVKQWTLPDGQTATAYQFASGVDRPTFMVADTHAQDADINLMLWCHGSGGGNQKLTDSTTGWVNPRDGWLMNGGAIIEAYGSQTSTFNGTQHWARVFARNGYSIPTQRLADFIDYDRILVVGTSMGGTISKYMATRDPFVAPRTVGLIDAAGIYNFAAEFDQGVAVDGKDRFDLAKYYGTVWPDRPSFITATADTDPARYDPAVWTGLPVFIIVGDADVTAVKERAGQQLWERHGPTGTDPRFDPASVYIEVPGAGHATSSMYNDPRILTWALARVGIFPPQPPTGGTIYNVLERGVLINGRKHNRVIGAYHA